MGPLSTLTTTSNRILQAAQPMAAESGFSFPTSGKIECGHPVGQYLSILVPAQGKLFDHRVGAVEIRIQLPWGLLMGFVLELCTGQA